SAGCGMADGLGRRRKSGDSRPNRYCSASSPLHVGAGRGSASPGVSMELDAQDDGLRMAPPFAFVQFHANHIVTFLTEWQQAVAELLAELLSARTAFTTAPRMRLERAASAT